MFYAQNRFLFVKEYRNYADKAEADFKKLKADLEEQKQLVNLRNEEIQGLMEVNLKII